jgi:hypothetical protein
MGIFWEWRIFFILIEPDPAAVAAMQMVFYLLHDPNISQSFWAVRIFMGSPDSCTVHDTQTTQCILY